MKPSLLVKVWVSRGAQVDGALPGSAPAAGHRAAALADASRASTPRRSRGGSPSRELVKAA